MNPDISVAVRYYRLSAELQPCFTALYRHEFACAPGEWIRDCLHPEWATMRFTGGTPPIAAIGGGDLRPQWPFVVSGPTGRAIQFGVTSALIWGLGLQPAGWARFVDGRAADFADRTVDGNADPAFALFRPIHALVCDPALSSDDVAEAINACLMALLARPSPHEAQVLACHEALRDPEVADVGQLEARLGIGRRSLERLCARYFGFPPKQLIRRQRFLRSLADFMLKGRSTWSDAIDLQYHDQPQFVREFHRFMGMTPSEYAETPHPIIERMMAQRMADQGAAPQTDLPTVLRYAPPPGQAGA